MKSLYENTLLGGIKVRNRFVRSATKESMSPDGNVTSGIVEIHKKLAQEEVGLIIVGAIEVTKDKVMNNSLSIFDDSFIKSYETLTDAVHEEGVKVLAQLLHGGSQVLREADFLPLGPSPIQDRVSQIVPKEMSNDDIEDVIRLFSDAALRSKKAGFDGVQIGVSNGFLLNKFISPYYNRRSDEYGGSVKNRSKILVEIRESIARECGDDFPVFVKLSIDDCMKDDVKGLEFPDGKEFAKVLAASGYDAIELIGGILGEIGGSKRPTANFDNSDGYFKNQIIEISKEVQVPLIAVGGIRSEEVAQELISHDNIEAVSFSRPFICDTDLISRWKNGEKSRCTSCYQCALGKPIKCIQD